MVQDRGVALKQVVRDLDLNENMLRRWVREFGEDPQDAFPGLGQMKPEQVEIARLQREVAKLKMERDILKKAAAYFAKESM
jgi:transposase